MTILSTILSARPEHFQAVWEKSWTSQLAIVTTYWTSRWGQSTQRPLLADGSQPSLWTLLQSNHGDLGKCHCSYFTKIKERGAQRTQTYPAHHGGQEGSLHLSAAQCPASEAACTELWACTWSSHSLKDADSFWPEWFIDCTPFSWVTRGIWWRNSAGDMPYISCHIRHWENHLWQ